MTGFVYFLRCGDFVKIGYSTNPKRRLRYLQTATPFEFKLIGVHPGHEWQERRLHQIFAPFRHRHEWFRENNAIIEIAVNGIPSMDAPRVIPSNGLREYLNSKKIPEATFAGMIGVSQQAVSHWTSGAAIPRRGAMARIFKATDGAVTANDFMLPTFARDIEAAAE